MTLQFVLGIDCFTSAGLKEFWAYIFNLNDNLFPLGATSYPVTKGMKVEIAAIIVIFLVGIVSQLELWKVIAERRQNRVDEEMHDDGLTDLEQAEEVVARRIADRILKERKQWEDVYGDKDVPPMSPGRKDSGIADMESQRKRSQEDTIEMSRVVSPTRAASGMVSKHEGGPVVVRVARDEPSTYMPETQIEDQVLGANGTYTPKANLEQEQPRWVGADGEEMSLQISSKRVTIPGKSDGPKVVPLPFQVPKSEAGDDDGMSVATFADEDINRRSKHLSASSAILRKLSNISHRSSRRGGDSSEDLIIPRAVDIEDDRASSMAATVDGLSDDEEMSPRSSFDATHNEVDIIVNEPEVESPTVITPTTADETKEVKARPISELTEATNILDPVEDITSSRKSNISTVIATPAARASITIDQLPSQLSKVITSYRTNEWSKHLESAENPELDELKHIEYPTEIESKPVEAVAPVDVEALQQTAETTSRSVSQMSNRPPLSRATSRAHPALYRADSTNGQYQNGSLSRSTSQQNIRRTVLRSSSTPTANGSMVESPIEHNNYGFMGKRDSIVRAKQSYYANGAALTSMPEFPRRSVQSSDAGVYNNPNQSTPAFADDDNISLSARRSLLLQQPNSSYQPKRQSSTPTPMAREQQLASWRASVSQDLLSGVAPKNNMERSRNSLFQERQAEEQRRVTEAKVKAKRESLFDERMRRGDMQEAHRDALRKMQAKANKAVKDV